MMYMFRYRKLLVEAQAEDGKRRRIVARHCGLVESARTWDGTGCEFDSWQCRIYIISHVHQAYDYLGPFGILWVHMAWHKNCDKNLNWELFIIW